MNAKRQSLVVALFFFLQFAVRVVPVAAQKESVRPGINKQFENPKIEVFVGRFEREGRDSFDHREDIVRECQIKPGMAVADIGAGTGLFTRLFSLLVGPKGRVYAVDISDKFVDHIKKAAADEGLKNVVGVVCSPDSVNLPDASIDFAFICDTYHHFEFPQRTLASIHRALRPSGVLVLIEFHRIEGKSSDWIMSHVRAGQEVFAKEVVDAGFREVEEKKDLLKESYFLRFEKVSNGDGTKNASVE
jgi:predicted methyltransferase